MFKCQGCQVVQPPRVKARRLIVERRDVTYLSPQGEPIGKGWEIAKEIVVGPCCQERGKA